LFQKSGNYSRPFSRRNASTRLQSGNSDEPNRISFPRNSPAPFFVLSSIRKSPIRRSFLWVRTSRLWASAPSWDNPSSWTEKRLWVEEKLGADAHKRLVLTHRKDLLIGDFLIDDRTKNGAGEFLGKLILFGSSEFPDWSRVEAFLLEKGLL
jgi:hypothetical protein